MVVLPNRTNHVTTQVFTLLCVCACASDHWLQSCARFLRIFIAFALEFSCSGKREWEKAGEWEARTERDIFGENFLSYFVRRNSLDLFQLATPSHNPLLFGVECPRKKMTGFQPAHWHRDVCTCPADASEKRKAVSINWMQRSQWTHADAVQLWCFAIQEDRSPQDKNTRRWRCRPAPAIAQTRPPINIFLDWIIFLAPCGLPMALSLAPP